MNSGKMLISLKHKFIFVANTKTASTSIELALKDYSDIILINPPSLKHMTYSDIVRNFQFLFAQKQYNLDEFYKFGVFRNPVDWIISWFNYRSRSSIKDQKNYLGNTYFGDFIDNLEPWILSQKRFFIDSKGENAMDFLIDYSNFEKSFMLVLKRLGIKDEFTLPHKNISSNIRICRDDLPDHFIRKIESIYSEDYYFYKNEIQTLE